MKKFTCFLLVIMLCACVSAQTQAESKKYMIEEVSKSKKDLPFDIGPVTITDIYINGDYVFMLGETNDTELESISSVLRNTAIESLRQSCKNKDTGSEYLGKSGLGMAFILKSKTIPNTKECIISHSEIASIIDNYIDPLDIYTAPEIQAAPTMGIGSLNDMVSNFAKKHYQYGGHGGEKVYFVVKSDGSIGEVRPYPYKDNAIATDKINDEIQFIKSLQFTPAKIDGKKVNSWQYITIPYWDNNPTKQPHLTMRIADEPINKSNENKIFDAVEEFPVYPGSTYYLSQYLQDKICKPIQNSYKNISGRIILQFVVEKDGSLSNIEVVRSISPDIDSKVINLVKLTMPRWFPGKVNGKIVRSRYIQVINLN